MSFAGAVRDLDARQPERMVPDLTRIEKLVQLLDHPERAYPSVQVTGTNGKTTAARAVGSILCAHGLSVGVYTSPHLHSVTERLAVCGSAIPEGEFGEEYERLRPYLEAVDAVGERVTYFEALTALAFLWFADKPVNVGVFEVGMGGIWDATNLVRGEVAVLCPIGLDHPELGATVDAVAAEKAGVIKPGATAVVREQRPEALAVIEARAADLEATILLEDRDWGLEERTPAVGGQRLTVRAPHARYRDLVLPLHGEHQARNAAAAVTAAESFFGRELEEDSLLEGIAAVRSPGRLETVAGEPPIVLDGAHNPDAAAALAEALMEAFTWRRLFLVLAVLRDKDVDGILAVLAPLAERAFVSRSDSPRALDPRALAEACERAGIAATVHPTITEALDAARAAAEPDDLIVVTGSLYTVAAARAHLGRAA